jgi:WD40 repeat protein
MTNWEVNEVFHNDSAMALNERKMSVTLLNLPDIIITLIFSWLKKPDQLTFDSSITNHHIRNEWVRVFRLTIGIKFRRVLEICGSGGLINCLLPLLDSHKIAIGGGVGGGNNGIIKIWNLQTVSCERTFISDRGAVKAMILSSTPGNILAGYSYGGIIEWDIQSNSRVTLDETFSKTFDNVWVSSLIRLNNTNGTIVCGSKHGQVVTWTVETGKVILNGHSSSVICLADLQNDRCASGSEDRSIKIWNVVSNDCLQTFMNETGIVTRLVGLSDELIASGSDDKNIKIWNLTKNECEIILSGHTRGIRTLLRLHDGRIASGSVSSEKSLRIWNYASSTTEMIIPSDACTLCQLSDGRLVGSNGSSSVNVWNLDHSGAEEVSLFGSIGDIRCATQLMDGRLAFGTSDGMFRIWHLLNRKCDLVLNSSTNQAIIKIVQVSEEKLAVSCYYNSIQVWNIAKGLCELKINSGYIFANLLDGRIAVATRSTDEVQIWNVTAEVMPKTHEKKFKNFPSCVSLMIRLIDGRIAVGSQINPVVVCDINTGERIEIENRCWSLSQLRDGRLVLGGAAGMISIWKLSEVPVLEKRIAVPSPMPNFGFSSVYELSDGLLAAGSTFGSISFWNLDTGVCERTMDAHKGAPNFVELKDGRIASVFGEIKLWRRSN